MLGRLAALVAVLVVLLVGAAALYLREGPGKRLGIVGLRLEAPFTLAADDLTVADPRGVWLRIERPLISWRPRALLVGTIDIPRLEAARIEVLRWPEGDSSSGQVPALPLELRLGHAVLPIEAPGWTLRLEGGGDLRLPLLAFDAVAEFGGAHIQAIGDLALDNGRLRLGFGRVTATQGQATVTGIVADWGRRASLRLRTSRVTLPGMAGAASGTARVAGDLIAGRLRVEGGIRGRDLASGNAMLDRLLGVRPLVRLVATMAGGRVRLVAARLECAEALLWSGGTVFPRQNLWVTAIGPDTRAGGSLMIAEGQVRARLTGNVARFDAWRRVVGLAVEGRADFAVGYDASRLDATIAVDGMQAGGLALPHLVVTAQGDSRDLRVVVDGGQDVTAAGDLRLGDGGGTVTIDHLAVAAASHRVRLERPARLVWNAQGVTLPAARLAVDDGAVVVSGQRKGRTIAAEMRLQGVALDLIRLALPEVTLGGRVGGSAQVSGTLDDPQAKLVLDAEGVGGAKGFSGLAASLDGTWRNGRAELWGSVRQGRALAVTAEASLPLEFGGGEMLPAAGAVSGRMRVDGAIGHLAEALPLAGNSVAGTLSADLRLGGTVATPRVSGTARLGDGRLENAGSGAIVTGLNATLRLDGDRVTVEAAGGDGGKGRLRLEGEGELPLSGAPMIGNATAAFDGFHAVRRDDLDATLSGKVDLAAGAGGVGIKGRVAMERGEIDVGRLGGAAPVTLDVIEVNRPPTEPAPPETPPPEVTLALGLDVQHAFVRGKGLDSEWKGRLDIAGTLARPQVAGKLMVVRGQYDLVGRSFRFEPASSINFLGGGGGGSGGLDPALDITATAKTQDITATVTVGGTAKKPELDFTSEPPLPKDAVLARVLFGNDIGKLSTFQQLLLAQMAAGGLGGWGGLGGKGGFDPLGDIRGALGIDVLQVGGGDTSAATGAKTSPTLSLGKYIGSDTFVHVDQGTAGIGKVTVEEDVGHGFSLSTSYGQQAGGGLGMNWRLDY